ncbi:hypothetical protein GOV14_03845 [Candidatus Pacearchaeota archaeon]|nr:hypothetical protein [Candidatus Pacearchaeota archaeon]
MKKQVLPLIIVLTLVLILVSPVFAQVTEKNYFNEALIDQNKQVITTNNPINNPGLLFFVCSDKNCQSISSTQWQGTTQNANANFLEIIYPTILQEEAYGIYAYKDGYIPAEIISDWAGSGNAVNTNTKENFFDRYLGKAEMCSADLNDIVIEYDNDTKLLLINVHTQSPISHGGLLDYVPPQIKDHYQTQVDVNIKIEQEGNIIYTDSQSQNIDYSGEETFLFDVSLDAGNYTVHIFTTLDNEDKCNDYEIIEEIRDIEIIDDDEDTEILDLSIDSGYLPNPMIYDNETAEVRFLTHRTNGTQLDFPVEIKLNNVVININTLPFGLPDLDWGVNFGTLDAGDYNLQIITDPDNLYEETNEENNIFEFMFTVYDSNNDNNDTTPPGSITNLHVYDKSYDWIEWVWDNPTDLDFYQNIIFIDGSEVHRTSNNYYKAIDLNEDTRYTITVHTMDLTGNINDFDVSNTARTKLEDDDDDDDDDECEDGEDCDNDDDECEEWENCDDVCEVWEDCDDDDDSSPSIVGNYTAVDAIILGNTAKQVKKGSSLASKILFWLIILTLILLIVVILVLIFKRI